jgi:hypothetical protein
MSARITRQLGVVIAVLAVMVSAGAAPALAQAKPRPRAQPSRGIDIGGYAMVGNITFAATESFDAILGRSSGPIVGGGARIGLPWGGLFLDVGAWRFRDSGERVFIFENTVIPLGIPVDITVTPIEISGGWRFRFRRAPRLVPYAAAGVTSLRYRETSDFSTPAEDVEATFNGYHLSAGAEYRITRWLGLAGEASWSTVPDAIGASGVSEIFDETDLGGRTLRLKITVRR